jgi:small subunit ribosomal protein S2
MRPYIFCTRNSIHIINIKETIKGLIRSKSFLTKVISSGKDVLFVGTKRQARGVIKDQATRCGMPYVAERWLGGTLTNFRTIRSRLSRLEELEEMENKGQLAAESKKMESALRREMRKIRRNLDGIRTMERLPGALVVVDARREDLAIREARALNIPTVSLLDTDSDPDLIDIPIPGNDDGMRAIEIIIGQLASAAAEAKAARPPDTDRSAAERQARPRSRRVSTAQAAETLTGGGPAQSALPPEQAPPEEDAMAGRAVSKPAGEPASPNDDQDDNSA